MTHLVKMLARNTSFHSLLPQWTHFSERCISRPRSTSRNEPDFSGDIKFDEKTSFGENKSVKKTNRRGAQPVILKRDVLREVRSVVGISVTPSSVGWAQIDLNEKRLLTYTSDYIPIENVDFSELSAYKRAKKIRKLIPQSDLYIMERCNLRKSREIFNWVLMLSSMLAVLLDNPTGPLGEENVRFQNPLVIDNLFKLTVGWERVSGGQVLQRMLGSTVAEQLDDGQSDITISVQGVTLLAKSEIVKSMFFSKPTANHSQSIALFIALSFLASNPIA